MKTHGAAADAQRGVWAPLQALAGDLQGPTGFGTEYVVELGPFFMCKMGIMFFT